MKPEQVKAAMIGRERDVLVNVAGIDAELLDGKHHPCPRCGGTDRFRQIEPGVVYCNQCFSERNGDALAAVQWMRQCTFPEAVALVAEYLGLAETGKQTSPAKRKGRSYPDAESAIAALDKMMQRDSGRQVAKWPYVDAGGQLVAYVVRYDLPTDGDAKQRKTFRPVSKHGDGWRLSDPPGEWPLYRLAELAGDDCVYICEGEKATDAARSIGLTATTSAHGSKSPHKTDWTPLAGRQCVILPDNDAPGRKYADAVAAILAKLTPRAECKTVALPGLAEGGDIVDWIEAHDSVEPTTLREQIESLPVESGPIIQPLGIAKLIEEHPTMDEPIINGILRRGETCNIIAPTKVGKSWLAYNIALCVCTGLPLFDRFETYCGNTLLVDNELRPATLAKRIPEVAEAMGLTLADYSDALEVLPLRGKGFDLHRLSSLLTELKQKYDAIIADAWYRFQPEGTSENDNAQQTQLYNAIDATTERTEAAWMNVHHSSKGNQSEKSVTDVGAGAGSMARAADTHLILRPHEDDGVYVLEAAVRSFPPIEPIALKWEFPLWLPINNVDTSKLLGRLSGQERRGRQRDEESKAEILANLADGTAKTARMIRKEIGSGLERAERLIAQLVSEGKVVESTGEYRGRETREYSLAM